MNNYGLKLFSLGNVLIVLLFLTNYAPLKSNQSDSTSSSLLEAYVKASFSFTVSTGFYWCDSQVWFIRYFGMNHGYLRLKLSFFFSTVVDWYAILAHSKTVHSQAISQGYIIHSTISQFLILHITRYRWANFETVYLYLSADALQSIKRGQ